MAIIRRLRLLAMLALLGFPGLAAAQGDDEDNYLRRGVYVDGQIWLLTDHGTLFRIGERSRRRIDEPLSGVLDICRRDGQVLVVTGNRDNGTMLLRRRERGVWRTVARIPRTDERLLALDCTDAVPITLLTTSRLIEMRAEGANGASLRDPVYALVAMTSFGTRDYLFVGLNSGEWGGGLRRIERTTGRVVTIENLADGACGGLLNTHCDPVQGIAPMPWRPGCIAAAVGLVHFEPSGRVVGICGERVDLVYSRRVPAPPSGDAPNPDDNLMNVAFFGIVARGDLLLAVGVDGLYRIGPGGLVSFTPFPAFREIQGVRLNLDQPDVVLAVTQINRRASVSGGAPLMIPR